MVETVAIARRRVDRIKTSYEWDEGSYDSRKPIAFIASTEERNGIQQPEKIVPQPFLKDAAMATSSSPSEPSASSSKPATARPQWRAKTQAAVPSAIMPSNTTYFESIDLLCLCATDNVLAQTKGRRDEQHHICYYISGQGEVINLLARII